MERHQPSFTKWRLHKQQTIMNRLLQPKNDSVDRQATFETDSTQAHRSRSGGIKRGALALPIVGSENSLKTPPIKERTFESEDPHVPDNKRNKIQKPDLVVGKNGINVKENNKKEKGVKEIVKNEKSEQGDKRDKIDDKQSKQKEILPNEAKTLNKNSKGRKPVTSTKSLPFNFDSEGNTENKISDPSASKNKTKEETRQSKLPEQNSNAPKKLETKEKGVYHQKDDSNDSGSKSSSEKEQVVVKKKETKVNPEAKDIRDKSLNRQSKAEETKSDKNKENQSYSRSKKDTGNKLETISKDDQKTTKDVKAKNVLKQGSDSKSEHSKYQNKSKPIGEKKPPKQKVYENEELSKSKTSVPKSAESDEDTISIDLLQFEGENSHLPPTSTALKDRQLDYNLQIDSFKSVPKDSQSAENGVKKDSKPTETFKSVPKDFESAGNGVKKDSKTALHTEKEDKNTKRVHARNKDKTIAAPSLTEDHTESDTSSVKLKSIQNSSNKSIQNLESEHLSETDTETVTEKNNSINPNKSNSSDTRSITSSTTSECRDSSDSASKHTQEHSVSLSHKGKDSPGKESQYSPSKEEARKERSLSPEKQTQTSDKRPVRLQSPDIDRYENLERSDPYTMEPSKSRQPGAERMTESYESVYAERKTLLDAEVTYKRRIKQLEDELNQFLRTIEDLRAENKALRSRIDDLESKPTLNDHENVSHQSKNTVVIDTEKIGLEARIEDLEKRNKDLEQQRTEFSARVRLSVSEKDSLSETNEELKKKIKDLEKEKEKFEATTSNDKVQKEPENSEVEDLKKVKSELDSLEKECENLRKENEKYKRLENLHSDEIEKLKQQVVDAKVESKKMEVEMEKYRELTTPRAEGVKSPNTEKMELKAQIIGLQTDNQSLNEEIIKLKAEHLGTLKKLHDLEKTATSFQSSVTAVESEKLTEIQTLQNENSKLQTENKTLQEALVQKKTELQELMVVMKDEDKFDTEIKELNDDKLKLTKTIEEKDEENQNLKKEIDELKRRHDEFEKQNKTSQSNIESLAKLNETRKAEIIELQKKLEESKAETEEEKGKLGNLAKAEKDIEEANSRASKLEKDLENERIKNSKLLEEVKAKQEKEIKDLNETHEQESEEWRKRYIELEKENQEEIRLLKLEIERLKAELEKMNSLKSAVKELEEAKTEIMTLQNKYSQVVKDLEERSQVEQRNFELSLKIDVLNKKIKQLEKENKELQVQNDNANDIDSSAKRLAEENKRLREIVDKAHLNTKIEVLERKQKDNETRVKQLEGWVGDLYEEPPREPSTYAGKHRAEKKKKQPFSKAAVPTMSEKTNKRPRSLEEVNIKIEEDKMTHSSTPALPNIFERDKNQQLSFGLGYSQIHKRRLNASIKTKK